MLYILIVELYGEEAQEAIDSYWHGGGKEVFDVLTNYDEGDEGIESSVSAAGPDDEVMRVGDYNVIVNPEDGTAKLEVVVQ